MSFKDIILSALTNLKRHKNRTILTAIGVMIGCTSILVMVSIGLGLTESQEKMIREMGALDQIQVYSQAREESSSSEKITDGTIKDIQNIDHVQLVSPTLTLDNYMSSLSAKNGTYKSDWASVLGISKEMLQESDLELLEGNMELSKTGNTVPVLAGQYLTYNFFDTRRPEGENMIDRYEGMYTAGGGIMIDGDFDESQLAPPYFQAMDGDMELSINASNDENYDESKAASFHIKPAGRVKENYQFGFQTSDGLIMDIDALKDLIKEAQRKAGVSLQEFSYSGALVKADSIDHVEDIENQIRSMGFGTESMKSYLNSIKEESRMIQMVLGGIGAVALVVAAIGITNTMIMSLTERIREIGIMKALGCKTKDIRTIFLIEAGFIGLIGGTIGVVLSYLISLVINYFAWNKQGNFFDFLSAAMSPGSRISYIPIWLAVFGLCFSAAIGLIAGYLPAKRTVKVSAIEAMHYI